MLMNDFTFIYLLTDYACLFICLFAVFLWLLFTNLINSIGPAYEKFDVELQF